MGTLPNDFNEGPFSVYAGAVNFTICGPGGFAYPVDSERYAWHYVQMLNEAYSAWLMEAEQNAKAQSALIETATKVVYVERMLVDELVEAVQIVLRRAENIEDGVGSFGNGMSPRKMAEEALDKLGYPHFA